jgi:uncharacterized protein YecT (DUF1311 family)
MPNAKLLLACMLGFASAPNSAFAVAPHDAKCNPAGNQQEMNACALQEFQETDRKLNAQYQKTMAGLAQKDRDALRREQRNWIKRRDSRCKANADAYKGGSIWPLEYHSCLASMTRDRTQELVSLQRK